MRVLVVDDDLAILAALEELLMLEGHLVATAHNGAVALARVEEQPPDLILLDLFMPIMDGVAFAQAYHSRPGAHAPLIILTAAPPRKVPQEAMAADTLIEKPFDLYELLEVLQRYAATKQTAPV
jgi:CheY-like chemotaxis protein